MTKFQERTPPGENGVMERLQALEREVQQLRAARRLEAATIGRGGVIVKGGAIILLDEDGHELARLGARTDLPTEPDGDIQPGFILRRNDGSIAFTLDDPDPAADGYRQLIKMHDAQGNIIFMEDYHGGWGLASPTFSAPLYPTGGGVSWTQWPKTNDNADWVPLWLGWYPAWNPALSVSAQATCSAAGVTGQVRLVVNGIPQSPVISATFSTWNSQDWMVDLASVVGGNHGGMASVSLEAKRTSATVGDVMTAPQWMTGYPSVVLP